ncbi:ABC transporter permease subunit [Asanoa sp. WMMD1127]|uniref:ABC transporter permease subunit n=1 Tax=Asanoa sp. WMMD1127 TaxID=3016107 RepID=UPI002416AC3C|nr:ABC transporter permease subunit [Asanoa sp. WMMD1127]MDG4825579.1 ABC transporter permease subunit [Asanoa sp. WMMD1127]
MLWLVWRQHRWQFLAVTAVTIVYCGYIARIGLGAPAAVRACTGACEALNAARSDWSGAVYLGNLLPAAVGIFWGAPLLARETEQGTIRLALTQSVSRRRWLATKLGVLAAVAAVLGLTVGTTVSWAGARFGAFADRPFGNDVVFSQAGLVPVAMWVFALLAGAALGAVLRRLMPALAATVLVLALAFGGLVALRPHLVPPVTAVAGADRMLPDPWMEADERGWIQDVSYVDRDGRVLSPAGAGLVCADPANTYPTPACLARTGLRQRAVYQPADRYVWFQLIEMGLLLVVSAGLGVVVRRRVVDAV